MTMKRQQFKTYQFSSVQSLSHVQLFLTPWTAACQASLSITNTWSLFKLMSIESVMPSNHFNLCCCLLKKKKSHKCPNWGTKTLSVLQKIVKIIKNKENLRNCYSKEKPKVIQFLHVIWYSGWDPGTEKGLKVKPREMRKKKKKKTLCIHVKVKWKWNLLNHIRLFVTSWTLQWVKFARPKYWSG